MGSKERLLRILNQNKVKVLEDISQSLVNEISQNHSPDTANRHMRNLKAFLNFCIKKQWYKRRGYEAFHFPIHRDKVWETIMCRQILSAVKDKDTDFYLFLEPLWKTGCRPNELSKLMGHTDISITAKHYINRDSGQIRGLLLG